MVKTTTNCQHTCGKICTLLAEAYQKEESVLSLYQQIERECTYPTIHIFIQELICLQQNRLASIRQKLEELSVRNAIAESIRASYDSGSGGL